ncbi:UNVERIFIED_CONTAM: hypothetical protein HDU68_007754 [Siphonaria sp. JEL0065]|nr:hypothetical protein HDU68_007754 [Siphonaria sp. JEL0065]
MAQTSTTSTTHRGWRQLRQSYQPQPCRCKWQPIYAPGQQAYPVHPAAYAQQASAYRK